MAEVTGTRLSKLVPLLDQVSETERRGSLPSLVSAGAISFYVRVPAGKAVYMDGIRRLQSSFSHAADALSQSLSPHSLSLVREAKRLGTPVIEHPALIRDAIYLGLSAQDAELLLAVERVNVHWFPSAVQLMPPSAEGTRRLIQVVPWRSPCCLRPDDGLPKRGPWIGQDPDHFLSITLSDVLVEQAVIKTTLRANTDPLDLRGTSPGAYVLYRAAVRFNDPTDGVKDLQPAVQEWVKEEAKQIGVDEWLFNKELLKQVKKLINTRYRETQGVKKVAKFRLRALGEDVAALHATHHWISSRMALLMHAARFWRHLVQAQDRVWASMDSDEQLILATRLGRSLRVWGFTTVGEWRAVFLVAAYPDDLRAFGETVLKTLKMRTS